MLFDGGNYDDFCRIAQIILEQTFDKERPLQAKTFRVYAPYWFTIARCPPLTCRLLDITGKGQKRKFNVFHSKKNTEVILGDITEEELYEGHTIASALNFRSMGLAVSIAQSGKDQFGPVKDLSSLGDMVCVKYIFIYPSYHEIKRELFVLEIVFLSLGWITGSLCL